MTVDGPRRCFGKGPVMFIWVLIFVGFFYIWLMFIPGWATPILTFLPIYTFFYFTTLLVFWPWVLKPAFLSLLAFYWESRSKSNAFLTLLVADDDPCYANKWLPMGPVNPESPEPNSRFEGATYPGPTDPIPYPNSVPASRCLFLISFRFWTSCCWTNYLFVF